MQEEFWKDLIGYEGLYQVSSMGRVKSLGNDKTRREKLLKPTSDGKGYLKVSLSLNKKRTTTRVHQIVAITFLNHKPCGHDLVVDHINDNRSDNRVDNLQIVTQRFNVRKTQGSDSSKYKGVCWTKANEKWSASISIKNKKKHLGFFNTELEASEAYQNAVNQININILQ
jgi:hypothetical protein